MLLLIYKDVLGDITEKQNTHTQTGTIFEGELVSSAENICKQFGPRSGPTFCRA